MSYQGVQVITMKGWNLTGHWIDLIQQDTSTYIRACGTGDSFPGRSEAPASSSAALRRLTARASTRSRPRPPPHRSTSHTGPAPADPNTCVAASSTALRSDREVWSASHLRMRIIACDYGASIYIIVFI